MVDLEHHSNKVEMFLDGSRIYLGRDACPRDVNLLFGMGIQERIFLSLAILAILPFLSKVKV